VRAFSAPLVRVFVLTSSLLVISLFFFILPLRAQALTDLGFLVAGNITRPSTGQFVSGPLAGTTYSQSSGSGFGASVEYGHWWAKHGLLIAYTRTPTTSVLVDADTPNPHWASVPINSVTVSTDGQDAKWRLSRNEFSALYARRFYGKARTSSHLLIGLNSILLDGGNASGFDHQFAAVFGAANDLRLSAHFSLRCEFLANVLHASNFGDDTYAGGHTVMFETKAGLVWRTAPVPGIGRH
jgi:hypothetical protein